MAKFEEHNFCSHVLCLIFGTQKKFLDKKLYWLEGGSFFILLSAFLRNFFLCQDRLSGDVPPHLAQPC